MEKLLLANEPSAESRRISVDIMDLVSRIAWRGPQHLSEFPEHISINEQIETIMSGLLDISREHDAESSSTVIDTLIKGVRFTKPRVGSKSAVLADQSVPSYQRRFFRPRVSIHTHLQPSPLSLVDLLWVIRKGGRNNVLGYFPAIIMVNEKEVWAAISSRETPEVDERDYWHFSNGLDHRVTNDEYWQNIELFKFAKKYNIALFHGCNRNSRLLVRVPRSR